MREGENQTTNRNYRVPGGVRGSDGGCLGYFGTPPQKKRGGKASCKGVQVYEDIFSTQYAVRRQVKPEIAVLRNT